MYSIQTNCIRDVLNDLVLPQIYKLHDNVDELWDALESVRNTPATGPMRAPERRPIPRAAKPYTYPVRREATPLVLAVRWSALMRVLTKRKHSSSGCRADAHEKNLRGPDYRVNTLCGLKEL